MQLVQQEEQNLGGGGHMNPSSQLTNYVT
jgi:hypothetical protein